MKYKKQKKKPSLQWYSIPLNNGSKVELHRMAQKCRIDMIDTVLERSCSPLPKNMYIVGLIFNQFM